MLDLILAHTLVPILAKKPYGRLESNPMSKTRTKPYGRLDRNPVGNSSQGAFSCSAQGDVRKYEDCERAVRETVARFGRLDVLVNCAAGNFLATAEELSSNGFRTGTPYPNP